MRTFAAALLIGIIVLVRGNPGLRAQPPEPCGLAPAGKVCVSEPKPTTRKAYACKVEEYCLPRCRFLSWLWGGCGCDGETCGDLRVRNRLVVKTVPGCDTKRCVPRAPPAGHTAPPTPAKP